jgi:hypothetical protein
MHSLHSYEQAVRVYCAREQVENRDVGTVISTWGPEELNGMNNDVAGV